MEIIHFTSEEKWDSIQSSGYLLPKTHPDNFNRNSLSDLKKTIQFDEYIVGIPVDKYSGWKDALLTHRLWQYTSYEVVLKFPVTWPTTTFVRDHQLLSPGRFRDDLKINIMDHYFGIGAGRIDDNQKNVVESYEKKFMKDYNLSSILLEEYGGKYNAPEVWSPQVTPTSLIERISFRDIPK
ncbi:hypothetical protein HOD61_00940 [archaeon]|jgi:hypothetical protein|nr:hypothetical protein [archaeon]